MKTKTRVIIAGAGIAGPVLAIFLKAKGYDPIVYEKVEALADVGLSLCVQPNGLCVLGLIPGFRNKLVGEPFERFKQCSVLGGEATVLVDVDYPSRLPEETGYSMTGVRRPLFNRTIVEVAESHGVEIVFGHQLVSIKQDDANVEVTFTNGAVDRASFVVGCDGLHSNTRLCLFGHESVSYTGLTQTGGISPTPESHKAHRTMLNVYSDGAHLIAFPINDKQTSWAITRREAEARETWRSMDEEQQKSFKEGPWSQWPFGVGELVRTADQIVKYGLYDRPELHVWHKGRVVLLGDAAHPTSPHLGQGANQAFEDIYHLVRLLAKHNPSAAQPSTELLSTIFSEYEELRIARTSELVEGARKQGNVRVVQGEEACRARNEAVKAVYTDENFVSNWLQFFTHPFKMGESEI
ncbi:FAD/NAD(P)-binding domain-containing protein [Daedalea quercina L-15889]|uniref:FAD/NAD(P)-binding domain-containing protein n=1 Tax=Daedalea quercina L-15889 TaxID=1314783 RepID=A0A165RKZ5_9APHY|nr:FAD/NAD(P)-binding domain-containing protein [Daedalea quercina L-15889]